MAHKTDKKEKQRRWMNWRPWRGPKKGFSYPKFRLDKEGPHKREKET